MKRQLVLILFLLTSIASYAQNNMVFNPSFELHDSCPGVYDGGIYANECLYWTPGNWGTADYFNNCDEGLPFSTPYNLFGFQLTHGGVAYAGFYIILNTGGSYGREYVQGSLNDSLMMGQSYPFKFFIANGAFGSTTCTDNIGIYCSHDSLYSAINYSYIPVTPYYQNPPGNWLNSFGAWQKIEGSFIAHGGERFFTIGNFQHPSDVHYNDCTGLHDTLFQYLYIDDVSIIDTSIIDTMHLCINDSVQIGNQWHKTEGLYYDTIAGIPVREYLQNYPHPAYFTHVDLPFHAGDSVRAGYVWMYTDSVLVLHYNSINGCDSTVYYHCRTNVGIDDLGNDKESINIYPNPAVHFFAINASHFSSSYSWLLYDLQGRLLQEFVITNKEQCINLSENISSGLYIWRAQKEGIFMQSGKLRVEK